MLDSSTTIPIEIAIKNAAAAISHAQRIVCACHVNPDGDAIGSMLGLALALRSTGKTVETLCDDPVPETLQFLPGVAGVTQSPTIETYSLGIGLDAGDPKRLGASAAAVLASSSIINIDHHAVGTGFGNIRVVDATRASTAELVYDLLTYMNLPITADIAQCLMTGIFTDTGGFRFPATSPSTYRMAAELREAGADANTIATHVYESRSESAQRLLGRALANMGRSPGGDVVWSVVTAADFAQTGTSDADTEGISHGLRCVRGSKVALLLREQATDRFRVSLRSQEGVDVATVANQFGGGGHRLASGCTMSGNSAAVLTQLLAELSKVGVD